MPLYVSLVFERYKLSCFCSGGCTSDLLLHVVLPPFTSTSPPEAGPPRPPVNVLASPLFSVFPSSTHLLNALSPLVCVSCVVHSCVCVCVCHVIVWTVLSAPLFLPFSHLHCVTWIYLFCALLLVIEMYQIFPPTLLILIAPSS